MTGRKICQIRAALADATVPADNFDEMSTDTSPARRPSGRGKHSAPAPAGRTGSTAGSANSADTAACPGRIPIVGVQPVVDCGAYPAKAVVGEQVTISATVFREGHDALSAGAVLIDPSGAAGPLTPMRLVGPGTDHYQATVAADAPGDWSFRIEAWGDPLETWRHDAGIKLPEGLDVELVLEEGARLHEQAAAAIPVRLRAPVEQVARVLRDGLDGDRNADPVTRLAAALAPDVLDVLARHPLRPLLTTSPPFPLRVDRTRALFGAWYEFFPRSVGASLDPPRSGTFATAADRLPAVADMGFDVVYLPPIHPIGTTFRKGANNALAAGPDDPGVPWAIGSAAGGHDAIHPDLGTFADFDAFVARAKECGLEVALDFALQASPDHPWVSEHPEWFTTRADGSIAYAENPPKKYQDIYPLNFDNDPDGIYREILRILHVWMDHGVRIFRVDNPHTKPVNFWARLLADIRHTDPDVIFLAEAFTRPAMMHQLAKVGFHQSYTYFTWRNTRTELEQYLMELSHESADFLRPNFFVNTPDILHAYLQQGGPPAFKIRAVIAALASPSWGMYSGYELFENTPARVGSEEYLDSEKYQYRPRDYEAAEAAGRSLAGYVRHLNRIRRDHVSLQQLRNLSLHGADNQQVLTFSKRTVGRDGTDDTVLVVVNLNPFNAHEATVSLDMPALGLDWDDTFDVVDLLSGQRHRWGHRNYVRLDPHLEPAHVFVVDKSTDGRAG